MLEVGLPFARVLVGQRSQWRRAQRCTTRPTICLPLKFTSSAHLLFSLGFVKQVSRKALYTKEMIGQVQGSPAEGAGWKSEGQMKKTAPPMKVKRREGVEGSDDLKRRIV